MSETGKQEEKKAKEEDLDGGLDGGDDGELKITSKDKLEYTVTKKNIMVSKLIKTSIENDQETTEVPIPGVVGEILKLVIDYCNHHKGVEPPIIEKPLRSKIMKDVCKDKWDAEFIDKIGENRQTLYDLILAANYMDIKSLLHLGCAKVASLIKGQPLEKIKDILSTGQKKGSKKEDKKEDD